MSEGVCAIIGIEGTSWRIPQPCAGSNPSRRHRAPAGPLPACAPRIGSCSSGSIPGWPHPITVGRSGGTDLKTTSGTSARHSGLPKRDDELLTRHRYHHPAPQKASASGGTASGTLSRAPWVAQSVFQSELRNRLRPPWLRTIRNPTVFSLERKGYLTPFLTPFPSRLSRSA